MIQIAFGKRSKCLGKCFFENEQAKIEVFFGNFTYLKVDCMNWTKLYTKSVFMNQNNLLSMNHIVHRGGGGGGVHKCSLKFFTKVFMVQIFPYHKAIYWNCFILIVLFYYSFAWWDTNIKMPKKHQFRLWHVEDFSLPNCLRLVWISLLLSVC